jgi:hypothetical protein
MEMSRQGNPTNLFLDDKLSPNGLMEFEDFNSYLECKFKCYLSPFEVFCLSKYLDFEKREKIIFGDFKTFMRKISDSPEIEYFNRDIIFSALHNVIKRESEFATEKLGKTFMNGFDKIEGLIHSLHYWEGFKAYSEAVFPKLPVK